MLYDGLHLQQCKSGHTGDPEIAYNDHVAGVALFAGSWGRGTAGG